MNDVDRRPKLLMVDDEARLLFSLTELLRDCAFEIFTATSGKEAIAQLSTRSFDVILLDLYLPDVSEHEVMDYINQNDIDAHVVVMSGGVWIDAVVGALRRGAQDYLRKPHSREELLGTLAKALDRRRLQRSHDGLTARLQASEKLHRYLVNSSPDMIYTLDHDGRFTFVSKSVSEMLGYRQEELLGQKYSILVSDKDLEQARYVFHERRVDERASRDVEVYLKRRANADPILIPRPPLVPASVTSIGMYMSGQKAEKQGFIGSKGVVRDVSDQKRADEVVFHQAYHDALTNLPNRILFADRLGVALSQARRSQTELAIIFIDLDRFKWVNDTLGHGKGDELLREAAKRMKACLRKGDTLARHGGDEFVAVLPDLREQNDAVVVAAKFLECLSAPFDLGEHVADISASIGISIYPAHGSSIEELLRHADAAMYEVKSQGKNGQALYRPSSQEVLDDKRALGADLSRAIDGNELEMYYQAKIDAVGGHIVGAEALLRWNHPTRGVVLPGEFLPFAEENGLMPFISKWTIDVVCRDMCKWNGNDKSQLKLSLNLSPRYLDHHGFYEELEAALLRYAVPPSILEVEISEKLCIGDLDRAKNQLGRLGKLGISLAVDDFGTGRSSLAYLRQLPIQTIKIDASLTRQIHDESDHHPVVLAIISIARGLKLNLVAEGVESEAQVQYLRENGCQTMQGFLFHRPMPLNRFIKALKA